jgi:hypothetical protein
MRMPLFVLGVAFVMGFWTVFLSGHLPGRYGENPVSGSHSKMAADG